MINYLYCKLRHSLLSQSFERLDMFLSDSVDFSCLIAKSVGQYNAENDIFLANITRTPRGNIYINILCYIYSIYTVNF